MEDNKKTISNYSENKLINSQIIKDQELSFIFKKTEKIATAVYMISNFFNTEEPLKWELRKTVTSLLKNILSFKDASLSGKEIIFLKVSSNFIELNTILNLAFNLGFVSDMNYEIVASEIDNLYKNILAYYERQISGTKALFNKDYFEVKKDITEKDILLRDKRNFNIKDNARSVLKDEAGVIVKDTIKDTIKDIKDTSNNSIVFNGRKGDLGAFFDKTTKTSSNSNLETLSGREQKIMEKIKNSGPVTIKDISETFTDVSEKTIQRELQKMYDRGQIKKEGERRWTKYFI
jgi:predicted transcriptional regulator